MLKLGPPLQRLQGTFQTRNQKSINHTDIQDFKVVLIILEFGAWQLPEKLKERESYWGRGEVQELLLLSIYLNMEQKSKLCRLTSVGIYLHIYVLGCVLISSLYPMAKSAASYSFTLLSLYQANVQCNCLPQILFW